MNKALLREQSKKKRNALSDEVVRVASLNAANRLLPHLNRARPILLYADIQNELSCRPLFEGLRARHQLCYFPRFHEPIDSLDFHEIKDWAELEASRLCPQPPAKSLRILDVSEACVAICPGLLFGPSGQRLGFGKGYYDRFLAAHPKALRIGWAYDFQIYLGEWKTEAHDCAMDYVWTPGGFWSQKRPAVRSLDIV